MKSGPKALAELPAMLVGLAKSEIEIVEPLPIEFSQATPTIARPSEAMQWLNAHHVQLADHPARAGRPRVDRRGRPRVRHLRLRAARRRGRHLGLPRVQRDRRRRRLALGRGDRRHDLPRRRRLGRSRACAATPTASAAKLLAGILTQHPGQPVRAGLIARSSARSRRPAAAASSVRTAGSHPRTSGRSTARSAACACCAAEPDAGSMPLYDYDCANCGRRFEVIHGVHADGPTACPLCGGGPVRKAITAAAVHFKGSGWAKKERGAAARRRVVEDPTEGRRGRRRRRATADGGDGSARSEDPGQDRCSDGDRHRRPPRPTDDGWRRRLDHPGRGGRDPRLRPTSTSRRRRSGAGRAPDVCPEHQARWSPLRPARRGPGAGRRTATRPLPTTSSRSCSRISAADAGAHGPRGDPGALPRPAASRRSSAPSSTPTGAPRAACSPTAWRSRPCSRSIPTVLLMLGPGRLAHRRRRPTQQALVDALVERSSRRWQDLIEGTLDARSRTRPPSRRSSVSSALVWTVSQFYGALDVAFARIFSDDAGARHRPSDGARVPVGRPDPWRRRRRRSCSAGSRRSSTPWSRR